MKIEEEAILEKNILMDQVSTIIISTVDNNGLPNASYAPFGVDNYNNLYIYVSELSEHTGNLAINNVVSIMLIEDESKSTNIFARKRLTIKAKPVLINRGSIEWHEKIIHLDKKFKESMKFLKDMSDFQLFQLTPIDALLVYGFGKAFRFTGSQLDNLKHVNDKGHKLENHS